MFFEWLKAIFFGILEGVTEWLPVSSTGHLILLESRLPFAFSHDPVLLSEFYEMFSVVIQLGAIAAVALTYRERLFYGFFAKETYTRRKTRRLWRAVLPASIPAALFGIFGDILLETLTGKDIHALFYNVPTVATALILYGVAFVLIERRRAVNTLDDLAPLELTPRQILSVGMAQALSIIPGTSRSGSTILGGMLAGLSRKNAAEFSFFMAIPVMLGAGGIKLLGFFRYLGASGASLPVTAWVCLALGCIVSFAVSFIVIGFLTDFVKKHSFGAFGIYRIVLGLVVLCLGR